MEMLIVVAIIGIMAGITVPNFMTMIRSNRIRAISLDLLAVIRQERSRALSLGRSVQLTINPEDKTYTVTRLLYQQYDPLSADQSSITHSELLYEEPEQVLESNAEIDRKGWLTQMEVVPEDFVLVFTPSGTVFIEEVPVASVKLEGEHIGYEIQVYKGGQIDIFKL